jgi:hypothetical protein
LFLKPFGSLFVPSLLAPLALDIVGPLPSRTFQRFQSLSVFQRFSRQDRQPLVRDYCEEIASSFNKRSPVPGHRKLPEMAIIAAAMRKLPHLIYGVLKNQLPFDPNYSKQFAFTP